MYEFIFGGWLLQCFSQKEEVGHYMDWTVIVRVGDCIMLLSRGKHCMVKKKFWVEKRWGQIYSIGISFYVWTCVGLSLYCFPDGLGMVNIFWGISFIEHGATCGVSGMCRYCCLFILCPCMWCVLVAMWQLVWLMYIMSRPSQTFMHAVPALLEQPLWTVPQFES